MRSGLITVLRTMRLDRSSNGSLLFWHRPVLKTKRIVFVRGSQLTQLDRTVRFRFKNLAYDASCGMYFRMHAAFLWTINDYPRFGNVFGWRTKGYHACYTCNDEPYSETLESKIGYTNHRAYLPMTTLGKGVSHSMVKLRNR